MCKSVFTKQHFIIDFIPILIKWFIKHEHHLENRNLYMYELDFKMVNSYIWKSNTENKHIIMKGKGFIPYEYLNPIIQDRINIYKPKDMNIEFKYQMRWNYSEMWIFSPILYNKIPPFTLGGSAKKLIYRNVEPFIKEWSNKGIEDTIQLEKEFEKWMINNNNQ